MSQPLQLSLGVQSAVNNQYLFSDHYLLNLLPQDPRWQEAQGEAAAFLAWLQELYAHEQGQLANYNESQLEDHWIRPILERLGHVWEAQASVPGLGEGIKRPDYVYFPDEAARMAAVGAQNTARYVDEALAVGEVKLWDRSLDKKERGGGPAFSRQNPSYQIDYYLRATGLEWGVLSNGRLWRLVHRDSSQRLTIYYEVDLVQLLQSGNASTMRYFTLFFRQGALRPDAQGRRFLQDALDASNAYAVALEEDMQENVYHALELLMQGFLDLRENNLGPDDLRRVYDNSLYLLYRLLFILYAESRGLLPLDREHYREHYSLHDIKNDIARGNAPPSAYTSDFWKRVKTLFQIINGDNPDLNRELGVPRYNGGLFNPRLHPFLHEKAVGDSYLIRAIDLLSRRETAQGKEFADYRTLGVRQLGSIYEGLLEYQPRIATEVMVAVKDGGQERWLPEAKRPKGAKVTARRTAGQVYLVTDRGERKATGSYYTPQYIVEYIVENTVGPLVEEARGATADDGQQTTESGQLSAVSGQELVDAILNLKILDPAMGSGHFLVYATDYLALALATEPDVVPEDTGEDDIVYWKRRVVERCIYGVDRNPLAVELAKLSLWLNTVAVNRPLSFLDHHLKCGDSLVGADVADLGWAPSAILTKKQAKRQEALREAGQLDLFSQRLAEQLPNMMLSILDITGRESDTYESVQEKEAADRTVRQLKAPFEAVADLWTSAYFGNEFTPAEYAEALEQINRPTRLLSQPAVQRALALTNPTWRQFLSLWHVTPVEGIEAVGEPRRFFHWQLAFPEVFFDENGQSLEEKAGFDAVIGNPPYGARLSDEKTFLKSWYLTSELDFDSYTFFLEEGVRLLRVGGKQGAIVPNMWLNLEYNEKLRRYLLSSCACVSLLDTKRVFEDAVVETVVVVLSKVREAPKSLTQLKSSMAVSAMSTIRLLSGGISIRERLSLLSEEAWRAEYERDQSEWWSNDFARFDYHLSETARGLIDAVREKSVQLGELGEVVQGLTAYDRYQGQSQEIIQSRAYHSGTPLNDTYRKYLQGGDVSRYSLTWSGEWISYGPWLAAPRDPKYFRGPRLLFREVTGGANRPVATFTEDELYYGHSVIPVVMAEKSLEPLAALAVSNSQLMRWFNLQTSPNARKGSFPKMNPSDVAALPIRRINFTTSEDERTRLLEKAQKLYQRYCDKDDLACVLGFVDHHLEQEQSDVVHDLLAFLAEQMIEMNKEKQEVVEAFWLDLEGAADGGAFETLRNKGKWESSLWKEEACRPFVDEESRSTRTLEEALGWNEVAYKAFVKLLAGNVSNLSGLVQVYRTHQPRYRALAQRLAATDRLIDQVVYRLYGLTEEEIAVVEGE